MTVTDDRTTNLQLKKPHPTNLLADDVVRLRETLDIIDAALNDRPESSSVTTEITTAVNAAVADLVNSAPAALDTLNELAAALGNDGNYAATVTAELSTLSANIAAANTAAAAAQTTAASKASLGLAIALG